MARTLLITFPSNSDAERFAKIVDAAQRGEPIEDAEPDELVDLLTDGDDKPQMDAMIARPTLGCKCTSQRNKGLVGYSRTVKYGWFVHSKCQRPTKLVVANFIANRIMGLNDLLPDILGHGKVVSDNTDAEIIDIVQRKESVGA